jgi:hypothetical protein
MPGADPRIGRVCCAVRRRCRLRCSHRRVTSFRRIVVCPQEVDKRTLPRPAADRNIAAADPARTEPCGAAMSAALAGGANAPKANAPAVAPNGARQQETSGQTSVKREALTTARGAGSRVRPGAGSQ